MLQICMRANRFDTELSRHLHALVSGGDAGLSAEALAEHEQIMVFPRHSHQLQAEHCASSVH